MDKKTGTAIGVGAGILALAGAVIALSNLDAMDKTKRDLKKAAKKVKKKSQKLADKAVAKAEDFAEHISEMGKE